MAIGKAAVLAMLVCTAGISSAQTVYAETYSADPSVPSPDTADTALRPAAQCGQWFETIFLPTGDLFYPLIADLKEPRFYLSYRVSRYHADTFYTAAGGYGEYFGLYRKNSATGYSWQSDFGGAIHAQFNLHSPSYDLVNADYTIGFPVTLRKGPISYRIAIFHQSSHLGDEFLLHNNVQRVELTYEAVEILRSQEWEFWRLYYGGEYIFHQGPTDLKPIIIHGGVEYLDTRPLVGKGRLVGGWDLKLEEHHKWDFNSSIKAGLQFDSSAGNGRYIRLLAEQYDGFTPYGQFYDERIMYVGIGVYLGFE